MYPDLDELTWFDGLTGQIFFYLVIKLSWRESHVLRVNLIWRVNLINSDFFSFSSLVFFFLLVFKRRGETTVASPRLSLIILYYIILYYIIELLFF